MKYFDWEAAKNEKLKQEREVGFEDVLVAMEEGRILDVLEHPNKQKYPRQRVLVVDINGYAFLVPFIEDETKIFLKTIIPSRKATRDYLIKPS